MKRLNFTYQAINFFYFTMMGSMLAFASNYLLFLGYSNAEIGILLALYSIVSFFVQPILVNYADAHPEIPLQKLINLLLLGTMIGSLILLASSTRAGRNGLVSILVVLIYASMLSLTPLINTAAFLFERFQIQINYGLARGIGSLAYAIISLVLGLIIHLFSPQVLPLFYILFALLTFLCVHRYRLKKEGIPWSKQEEKPIKQKTKFTFLPFIQHYQGLVVVLFGYMFVYTGHMIINNFNIQIISHVHGTSIDMGISLGIAAFMELPAMFGFQYLAQRFKISSLLKTALIFYLLKHILTYLASNVVTLYLAAFLQAGAFALFTPAIVYYINKIVAQEDELIGQTVNTMFTTASGIFGSILGGFILDLYGVSNLLLFDIELTFVGLLICIIGIDKKGPSF